MFDSREYEFSDITVVLGGKDIAKLAAVEYGIKQDKAYYYGKGSNPRSIQAGNKTPEGSISIGQSELETIIANSPQKDILKLQFDMIVSYGNPSAGDMLITDVLTGCQFTEWKKGMKQGDKQMEVVLPIMFLRVN